MAKTTRVVFGADANGMPLKEAVKKHVAEAGYEVIDLCEQPAADFVDAATSVAHDLLAHDEGSMGLCFDEYGVGSYMAATKVKGMVAANVSDERSAYMTREHNNARMMCMGTGVVGVDVACTIADEFLKSNYAGGRHQVRVDMLNKMA